MNALSSTTESGAALLKVSKLVNGVLALAIGYSLAVIALEALPRVAPSNPAESTRQQSAARSETPQQIAAQIARAHLLGKATVESAPKAEPVTGPIEDTRLNLTLHGVLAYTPPENALAIISSGGRNEKVFAIGDKVVGNATLSEVHPDKVIIRRAGKNEALRLPEQVAALNTVNNAPEANTQANQSAGGSIDLPTNPRELRDKLVKEPSIMADLVIMRPYKRNGQLIGFRIQPKKDPALLRNFGIEPGDVITSVNGIALTSNREGITALGKLRKATQVDLMVLRGGAEIPISVSLQ